MQSLDITVHIEIWKNLEYAKFIEITKDSFLRDLREVAPEMELFLENHG